jgi:hypothetical protein
LENLRGRDHSEEVGVDGRKMLEWIFGNEGEKLWNGCIWLRLGISDGLL